MEVVVQWQGLRKWETSCNGLNNNEKDKIHFRPFTHIKEIRLHHFFDPLSPNKESRILKKDAAFSYF